ncbi:dihydrolipoamide acetyltransferase family protein [Sciscionella sediminilitoris]|uniref:dihydrolipoamide acetyltransferase family protein n=1 Tax=Sciscionella sediminilitoris TaxID=1445613 RepID=UPI0004DF01C5|nr:dihydrolipoamide acetyltransferase family protein [Sciscionella sp. SE31]
MPNYKQFPLADTAEGLTEADILNWHVKPGDRVSVNQIVVEVETAKAAVELPIPWAGVVTELLVEPGQTVEVGTPILTVDLDPDGAAAPEAPQPEPEPAAEEEMKPLVGYGSKTVVAKRRARKGAEPAAAVNAVAEPAPAPAGGYVPLAKPPVRKLAKDLGVDLRALRGTGEGGVITREDVRGSTVEAPAETKPVSSGDRERRVPIKGVRKATAQAMVSSAFTAPHVTEFLSVDVTPMMAFRERVKNRPEFREVKLTPLAFAAKAVCLAARRTPDVNAVWDEEAQEIVYKDYVHLGIAAATPRGLIVPKVRDADGLSLAGLAGAIGELTATAREGKTPPADMLNGTFTISNVGVFGVDSGTPIINPGESAILALGAIREMPWVVDGELAVRQVCQLSLSFDHRVIDGEQGSRFLADVGAVFADPAHAITF